MYLGQHCEAESPDIAMINGQKQYCKNRLCMKTGVLIISPNRPSGQHNYTPIRKYGISLRIR